MATPAGPRMMPTMDDNHHPVVALVSLGCPKNLVDSERMLGILAEGGCVVGADLEEADVVLINTCGFLEAARQEALGVLAEAAELKRAGDLRRIVVAGCLCQRDGEALFDAVPEIDAIVGVNDREEILRGVCTDGRLAMVRACPTPAGIHSDAGRFRLTPAHTAYLRIAEGCSRTCTFCSIPSIRGPMRSKPPELVMEEARELVADGAVELNVIAQDTTAYGQDLASQSNLAELLQELNGVEGLEWIRLLYTYPELVTDELIDTMAGCGPVVPYVDMPLQHIADGVLRRMGRRGRREDILRVLENLRAAIPEINIRTTLIVGFPGETPEEFAELHEFVRQQKFGAMGVFAYSPEEGTPAAKMTGQVPEDVKARRLETLMLTQQEIAFAAAEAMVGKRVEVLVDGLDEQGRCIGRHAGQAPEIDGICYVTDPQPDGSMPCCEIIAAEGYDLIAKPL